MSANPAAAGPNFAWMARVLRIHSDVFRTLRSAAWPLVDLGIRLWLAQIFFVSGVLKLTNWPAALNLAATEYPVDWMNPVTAAYTGVAIELLGSILLAVGLLTRYAAFPLLILTLVIQLAYRPFDQQLFWAALYGWYLVQGAGPISLDRLLRKGLADSALPLAPRIVQASAWVRSHLAPYYLSALRIWLSCAVLHLGAADSNLWLPRLEIVALPVNAALGCAVLLLVGLGTRYISILLGLAVSAGAMMDVRVTGQIYWLMALAILIVQGPGRLSLDSLLDLLIRRKFPRYGAAAPAELAGWPRVVIVGAGFGGLTCAEALHHARVSVTLIDRANYHLFQPLLYQVATAAISPGDIASPVRPLFRDSLNTQVLLGAVTGIDTQRCVVLMGAKEIEYDYLVLATGAAHSYFGKDQWAQFAPGLKRIEDATEIRRRLLTAFEQAEATDDAQERAALLTFLIVGGGPTGVELAGAIAELARYGMDKEFRRFDPASARIVLVQSAPRVLPSFEPKLAAIAHRCLERLGVDVLVNHRVEDIDAQGVMVSGRRIAARTVLWAAGVMASGAASWLKTSADNAGRVKVGADFRVPGLGNVFAIGDTALNLGWKGQPVPGLAPAAKQGGQYVARVIRSAVQGRPAPSDFVYRHLGSLATIGRKAAVADFGFVKLWGAPAWWLWGIVHIGFLVGLRNRVATMVNWFWAYLTYSGGIRLITGASADSKP
jgi:NADH dehydrogenase FAD-containing subunit/uncharacterized membrane protein YphA (DoxX/SURF4 family)